MTKTVESVINITGEELREQVIERLKAADESFLRLVHVMLQTQEAEATIEEKEDRIIDYEFDGTPVYEKQFREEAQEALDRFDKGEGRPAHEVIKEKLEWIRSME